MAGERMAKHRSTNDRTILQHGDPEGADAKGLPELEPDQFFEVFVADQVLKDKALSAEELRNGVVGGGAMEASTGSFTFVNGEKPFWTPRMYRTWRRPPCKCVSSNQPRRRASRKTGSHASRMPSLRPVRFPTRTVHLGGHVQRGGHSSNPDPPDCIPQACDIA